jgi:dTDP-4-dehydrorhamnose reductase
LGVQNLALAAKDSGSTFVTISTDYVFDGKKNGFYTQDDEPNPQSIYAKSKLEGERLALSANPDSIIVRSGWIFGYGGTNFLSVMHKILNGGSPLKAISDAYGTPTFADDLAFRMRQLAKSGHSKIFHVTNGGEGASYFEFAEAVCEIGRFDRKNISAVKNDDLNRPAARPENSKLACLNMTELNLKPVRHWKAALTEFLGAALKFG